jgi:hypothetical protein
MHPVSVLMRFTPAVQLTARSSKIRLALVVLIVPLAGCGGGSLASSRSSNPSPGSIQYPPPRHSPYAATASGSDEAAMSLARLAEDAEEVYATSHNNAYTDSVNALRMIYPSLRSGHGAILNTRIAVTSTGYTVSTRSLTTGDTFALAVANGRPSPTCSRGISGGAPGACTDGRW